MNAKVTYVRVVAHTAGPMGPNTPMSENHWSIYLLLAEDGGSVRMNIRADPGNTTGRLEWSILAYPLDQCAPLLGFSGSAKHHSRVYCWVNSELWS